MAQKTKAWQQNRWTDYTLEDVADDEIKHDRQHTSSQANFHFMTMGLIECNGSLKIASYQETLHSSGIYILNKHSSQIEFISSSSEILNSG